MQRSPATSTGIHVRRNLAFHDFNPGKVHVIFGERFLDDAAVFVVADQAEPAGADAEARDLREIIRGDAAGVDFHARGVDFFFRAEQARHDGEIIHSAAADSDDVNFCVAVRHSCESRYFLPLLRRVTSLLPMNVRRAAAPSGQ